MGDVIIKFPSHEMADQGLAHNLDFFYEMSDHRLNRTSIRSECHLLTIGTI